MTFRYLGDTSEVFNPSYSFRRFGQIADMDEDFAQQKCVEGLPIIPEETFDSIGFEDAELEKYPSAISHMEAPQAFKEKKKRALDALHQYREHLRGVINAH